MAGTVSIVYRAACVNKVQATTIGECSREVAYLAPRHLPVYRVPLLPASVKSRSRHGPAATHGSFRLLDDVHNPPRKALTATDLIWPWAAFLAMLAWAWRVNDLFNNVPAYGDVLEVLWGLQWYAQSIFHGHNPLYYSAVFAPEGWQVATLAHGPILFVSLLPLYALGGAAFAFNFATLIANALAFGGMFKLARLWLRPFASTLAALAFTYWGFRWFRTSGHLHTLVATAMLPFEVWAWEQARQRPARRARWYVVTGLLWGISITASLYALWHGALLLLVWGLTERLTKAINWKTLATGFLVAGVSALAVCSPTLWLFWRGLSNGLTHFNNVDALVYWSASLNSLPIPSLMHPWTWLRGLAQRLDWGPFNEAEVANFGLTVFLAGLAGAIAARKDRRLWPLMACVVVGLVFAMGPVLKISGQVAPAAWLGALDNALWTVGRHLKPGLFTQDQPPTGLARAIPLPDILAAMLVPFWEGARVASRFTFVAALGLFILMGGAIERLKPAWLRAGLALVLVIEFLPAPTGSVPAQPATHPAFAWLQSQDLAGGAIIDLDSQLANRLEPLLGGDIIFATLYHHQATASAIGSYMPAHFLFLQQWFENTLHPLVNPELTQVMRFYHIRYLNIHMDTGHEQPLVDDARANPELGPVQCFNPPASKSPWPYRMCLLEVLPALNARINVIRRTGWSSDEPWGTWIEGQQASADWVATAAREQQLNITLLPVCVPGRPQHVTLTVNEAVVADHTWNNCDLWSAQVSVPARLVQIGWNHIAIQADVAVQPVNPATGQITDDRILSVAATQLLVGPP
jgi:hypothetical protein